MKNNRFRTRKYFYLSLLFAGLLACAASFPFIYGSGGSSGSSDNFSAAETTNENPVVAPPVTRPPFASSGSTRLFTIQGSGAGTPNGDYVSSGTNALNTAYNFYVEVPPGLGRFVVEIFDADIGAGGVTEDTAGRDRDRGGYDSAVTYTLIDPAGTTRATVTGDDNSPANSDNAWLTLHNSTTVIGTQAGHWRIRVDMSSAVTGGDDINAFGLRAHDGTSGAGGTELNLYVDSILAVGVNPPASGTTSRTYTMYPYVTSGCSCSVNDFDYDSNNGNVGSVALESRTGAFTQSFASAALSGNNAWNRDAFSGWTADSRARDYGVWSADLTVNSYLVAGTPNGNYANLYFSNFQAGANPPAANPAANALRVYLPNDAGATPVKPYLEQEIVHIAGPNPPQIGQTSRARVIVRLVNPTARPIAFSLFNLVAANVPGGGTVYAGNAQVAQGSIVSQPAVGGTGNITWNPGTLAAGATAILAYQVSYTPAAAGQRVPLTATPDSGNGTRAQFVDETGNTVQTRATFTLGAICELAATEGALIPFSNCGSPGIITPATLPNPTRGTFYSQTFNQSVTLYDGALPAGLTLSGSTLSGTPTQAGTFSFVLGSPFNPGLEPNGCASSRPYTLTVNAPPTAAAVEINGRVTTAEGKGVAGALITMVDAGGASRYARTNPFGYYRFTNVSAGATYIFHAERKNLVFAPQAVSVSEAVANLNFTAQ